MITQHLSLIFDALNASITETRMLKSFVFEDISCFGAVCIAVGNHVILLFLVSIHLYLRNNRSIVIRTYNNRFNVLSRYLILCSKCLFKFLINAGEWFFHWIIVPTEVKVQDNNESDERQKRVNAGFIFGNANTDH